LNISPKRLWNLLTDVSNYPEWQPKVEKVVVDEYDAKEARTVFIEHSVRKSHTTIVHLERIPNQVLLRILEETHTASLPTKIPTFSGSWTFEIIEQPEDTNQTVLKITEQGVIKKPLVRVTNLALFGYHRRLDRFVNDIKRKIKKDGIVKPIEEQSVYQDFSVLTEKLEVKDKKTTDDQQVLATDSMTGSKVAVEWDLMSEIYERKQSNKASHT
jgi:ribosome-associated toxin RatA of RatAB toxin-antitoxin module